MVDRESFNNITSPWPTLTEPFKTVKALCLFVRVHVEGLGHHMDVAFVDMNGRIAADFFYVFCRLLRVFIVLLFRFKSRNSAALNDPTIKTGDNDLKGA